MVLGGMASHGKRVILVVLAGINVNPSCHVNTEGGFRDVAKNIVQENHCIAAFTKVQLHRVDELGKLFVYVEYELHEGLRPVLAVTSFKQWVVELNFLCQCANSQKSSPR